MVSVMVMFMMCHDLLADSFMTFLDGFDDFLRPIFFLLHFGFYTTQYSCWSPEDIHTLQRAPEAEEGRRASERHFPIARL